MIRTTRRALVVGIAVAAALFLSTTHPAPAAARPDIPIGPADENAQTSQAITAILDKCVAAYEGIDALHATGHYLSVTKGEDSPTSYAEARVTIDFRAPDKLAIHCRSKTVSLDCNFIANGTTTTMVWADSLSAGIAKRYLTIPQPDSLAAFVDTHRVGGEILQDYSGAYSVAIMPQLLVSDNVHHIIYADIDRFIYEGKDEVTGHQCHRIRFIQSDPSVNVIVWIDAETYLERKTSFIYSYDKDYELVDSFEEAVDADMMVMTWDDITTDAAKFNKRAFTPNIPADYKLYELTTQSTPTKETKSLWESLVSSAAQAAPHGTTWSVTRQQGDVKVNAVEYLELPEPFAALKVCRLPGATTQSLAVGTTDGTITFHNNTGAEQSKAVLGHKIATFSCMETSSGEIMQLVTKASDSDSLAAWDLQGKRLWTYTNAFGDIRGYSPGEREPCVFVALGGGNGLRRLDNRGKVEYAYGGWEWGNSATPAPPAMDRVLFRSSSMFNVFDKQLHLVETAYPDEAIASSRWDIQNPAAPVITLGVSDDGSVLLQRRTEAADIVWTTMIQPKLDYVDGYGLSWVNIPIKGKPTRCLLCVLATGHIVITTETGEALYRGLFSADAASVKRNGGSPVAHFAIADLNGDGIDEAYIKLDKHLLRLEFS